MNIVHAQYREIKLIGGYQFWSNPQQAASEGAIPVVLSRPTLIDLVRLVEKYGAKRLVEENAALFDAGVLSNAVYTRNIRQLGAIEKAQA